MTQFLVSHGGLFLIVFADQSGFPFPAVPWLLAAGALAAGGCRSSATRGCCWSLLGLGRSQTGFKAKGRDHLKEPEFPSPNAGAGSEIKESRAVGTVALTETIK